LYFLIIVIEGSGATLVKKDTIITLNPDYSTNQVQNKDPTADLSEGEDNFNQ